MPSTLLGYFSISQSFSSIIFPVHLCSGLSMKSSEISPMSAFALDSIAIAWEGEILDENGLTVTSVHIALPVLWFIGYMPHFGLVPKFFLKNFCIYIFFLKIFVSKFFFLKILVSKFLSSKRCCHLCFCSNESSN